MTLGRRLRLASRSLGKNMKIKLLRSVLVGDADTAVTSGGTVVELDSAKAKEFVELGLAKEVADGKTEAKKAPEPENKMAAAPANKSKK